jgi:AcrR family transcriptional regulator
MMARIVKEAEYAARRNEILDVAQLLVYTKGYDQMTIQDILDHLQISKGAYYHYFGSKPAMLEALIERLQIEAEKVMLPIMQDDRLPALEKLSRFFNQIGRWKTERKTYLLALIRTWYADENALVRQKLYASTVQWVSPMLAAIIRQGIREGVLTTDDPDHIGEVALSLLFSLGDTFGRLLLSPRTEPYDLDNIRKTTDAYVSALERVVGVPQGSLNLIDDAILEAWFSEDENTNLRAEAPAEKISLPLLRENQKMNANKLDQERSAEK